MGNSKQRSEERPNEGGPSYLRNFRDQLQQARDRMGQTPAQMLRWVLEFIAGDLGRLRPGERDAKAQDLLFLPVLLHSHGDVLPTMAMGRDRISDADLLTIQERIKQGIHGLLAPKPRWWELPAPKADGLGHSYLMRIKTDSKFTRFAINWGIMNSPADSIVMSVVFLLLQAGDRLRGCRHCGNPFIATKRQEYCTPACSQAERNQRKKEGKQQRRPPAKGKAEFPARRAGMLSGERP
jgi:hypothetical protein